MNEYQTKTEELYQAMQHFTVGGEQWQQIRNRIIELNIRLVTRVTQKYKPYSEDNFQNGCIGLIKAAETYQPERGVNFANYACFCIEREIHMAYKLQQRSIEGALNADQWVRIDESTKLNNGDEINKGDLIWDENATKEMEAFVLENEMSFMCDNIIKPSIDEIAGKGKHMPTQTNVELWQKLEFAYIMDLVFIDSQKQRFNLSQLARQVGLSVTNVRAKHERVMEILFQRMWEYMALSFEEMRNRLRGNHKIPKRLLCLDPGKTTGWCLFEDGKLTVAGHVEDCYNDSNVNLIPLMNLLTEIKPDFIVYEDYKVYGHKLERHTFNPVFTVRLIGAIETFCQMNAVKAHKQMATTAKSFVTDEKLQQWGFYQTGKKHARDAIRHGCYFLLFYKRGQDIE